MNSSFMFIFSKSMAFKRKYQPEGFDTDGNSTLDTYLAWSDFDARFFDPQLGRWHVPDPAYQYASPYLGMGNNPVCGIDPDGKSVIPWLRRFFSSFTIEWAGGTPANDRYYAPGSDWNWIEGMFMCGFTVEEVANRIARGRYSSVGNGENSSSGGGSSSSSGNGPGVSDGDTGNLGDEPNSGAKKTTRKKTQEETERDKAYEAFEKTLNDIPLPVALTEAVELNVVTLVGAAMSFECTLLLTGDEAGSVFITTSGTDLGKIALGWDLRGDVAGIVWFYTGDESELSMESFTGKSYNFNVSIAAEGLKASGGVIVSNEINGNNRLIGVKLTSGEGYNPTILSGGYYWGRTDLQGLLFKLWQP